MRINPEKQGNMK